MQGGVPTPEYRVTNPAFLQASFPGLLTAKTSFAPWQSGHLQMGQWAQWSGGKRRQARPRGSAMLDSALVLEAMAPSLLWTFVRTTAAEVLKVGRPPVPSIDADHWADKVCHRRDGACRVNIGMGHTFIGGGGYSLAGISRFPGVPPSSLVPTHIHIRRPNKACKSNLIRSVLRGSIDLTNTSPV